MVEMVKKRIIVTGNVQGAGFGALIKKIARSMGIKGRVQNLDDGSVEIYCEAEAGNIEKFLGMIDLKRKNGNIMSIDVQEMVQYPEGTEEYDQENAPSPFNTFEIKYGRDISLVEGETLERQELLIIGGSQVLDGLTMVGQKVDSMHEDMNMRFDNLDGKYGLIGQSLIETNKNLERMNENNAKTNENIKELIEGNAKSNENIKNLTETMMKIVEDYIAEKRKRQDHIEGQT